MKQDQVENEDLISEFHFSPKFYLKLEQNDQFKLTFYYHRIFYILGEEQSNYLEERYIFHPQYRHS